MFYLFKVLSVILTSSSLIFGNATPAVAGKVFFPISTPKSDASSLATTQSQPIPVKPQRVFYYYGGKSARASFAKNIDSIDVIAPQTYSIDPQGTLTGSVDPELLKLAKKHRVNVMPLFIQKDFKRKNAEAFLDNRAGWRKAISMLVNEAVKHNYWGWQNDFEAMDASYRDKFTAFNQQLNSALKEQGKGLSIAVISQISDNPADHPVGSWKYFAGAYDYANLAANADFISIMSYDDPGSTGPVARYGWVKQVLDHALKHIPNERLSLGIPLYYWEWNTKTGKKVDIGAYPGIQKAINTYGAVQGYSAKDEAAYVKYTVGRRRPQQYVMWYENARSIEKKMDLIEQYDLHGFSAWALGQESPDLHKVFQLVSA